MRDTVFEYPFLLLNLWCFGLSASFFAGRREDGGGQLAPNWIHRINGHPFFQVISDGCIQLPLDRMEDLARLLRGVVREVIDDDLKIDAAHFARKHLLSVFLLYSAQLLSTVYWLVVENTVHLKRCFEARVVEVKLLANS